MSSKQPAKRLGRPPGADAEATQNEILDVALHAFADRGYDGASIRDITNQVGVGHNLVRHYFGTKDDLWRAAVRRGIGEPAAELAALLETAEVPAPATVRAALELLMTTLAENPDGIRLLAAEALRGGERFDYIYDELIAPAGGALLRYAGVAGDGPHGRLDPRVLGLYLLAAGISMFSLEALADKLGVTAPQPGAPLDDHAHQLIDLIVAGAAGGMGSANDR